MNDVVGFLQKQDDLFSGGAMDWGEIVSYDADGGKSILLVENYGVISALNERWNTIKDFDLWRKIAPLYEGDYSSLYLHPAPMEEGEYERWLRDEAETYLSAHPSDAERIEKRVDELIEENAVRNRDFRAYIAAHRLSEVLAREYGTRFNAGERGGRGDLPEGVEEFSDAIGREGYLFDFSEEWMSCGECGRYFNVHNGDLNGMLIGDDDGVWGVVCFDCASDQDWLSAWTRQVKEDKYISTYRLNDRVYNAVEKGGYREAFTLVASHIQVDKFLDELYASGMWKDESNPKSEWVVVTSAKLEEALEYNKVAIKVWTHKEMTSHKAKLDLRKMVGPQITIYKGGKREDRK